jgi:hypothetical protein
MPIIVSVRFGIVSGHYTRRTPLPRNATALTSGGNFTRSAYWPKADERPRAFEVCLVPLPEAGGRPSRWLAEGRTAPSASA